MNKFWLKEYRKDMPHEIDINSYTSLITVLLESTRKYKDKVAFNHFGTNLSFKKLEKQTRSFASYLQNVLNISKNDRLAIMMPNIIQYPVALFGALRAGCTIVNINPFYTSSEIEKQINDAKVKTIVLLENFAKKISDFSENTCLKNVIVTKIGDLHSMPKRHILNGINKYVRKVKKIKFSKTYYFKKMLSNGTKHKLATVNINRDDIAFLQYTGGTTGVSKAAVLSHGNILVNMDQGMFFMPKSEVDTVVITALPLYHIFSLTANLFAYFKQGAKNILVTNPRNISGFIKILKKHKFTFFSGVNTLYKALIKHPKFKTIDFSALNISLSAGMTLQKKVSDAWYRITGSRIIEGYGLTEASPCITMDIPGHKEWNGSVGFPVASTDIYIRKANGNVASIGEVGELCVKGPQIMQSYWNNPKETDKVFENGWLRTGDLAKIDEKGRVYIVDRIKDMIIVSGFNVYPNEVEEVLASHKDVLEVGVVGQKNSEGEELVTAYVVSQNKNLQKEELKDFCRQHLARYKVPRKINFIDSIPKSFVGKILRKELREIGSNKTLERS